MDGHVGGVSAVEAVGVDEAYEHAVAEDGRERFRRLVAERGDPEQGGQLLPVHRAGARNPGVVSRRAPSSPGARRVADADDHFARWPRATLGMERLREIAQLKDCGDNWAQLLVADQ